MKKELSFLLSFTYSYLKIVKPELRTAITSHSTFSVLKRYKNRPFSRFMTPSWLGANTAKITVNVWNFCPLGTAITPLRRGGFPTFATTLNGFIDIIHSTENKAIKRRYDIRKFEL